VGEFQAVVWGSFFMDFFGEKYGGCDGGFWDELRGGSTNELGC